MRNDAHRLSETSTQNANQLARTAARRVIAGFTIKATRVSKTANFRLHESF